MQLKDHIIGLLLWISSCHKSSDLEKNLRPLGMISTKALSLKTVRKQDLKLTK